MRFLPVLILPLLASCAPVAESSVRTALTNAGLSESNADCMAERMVDRLSIAQLRKLERLRGTDTAALGRLSIPEFLRAVRRVDDPEVVAVTTSSAALCAAGIAR